MIRISAIPELLRVSQIFLISVGFLALGYCGYVAFDSWNFQRLELQELARIQLQPPQPAGQPATPVADSLIGRIEVRRLGLSTVVLEGTSTEALRRAAGHIAGTSMPGSTGNVGIAAHRDTFFRPLRNIRKNDIITLTTSDAEYRYQVVSTKVVPPADVSVLDPGEKEILTLVTCYPFFFIGSAPDRFIVRAERII